MSGHELSHVANKHFSIVLLNEAVADLVNAHARLDISRAWGDGTAVAADGTHMDTYLDNLLSETSVRYGKPGGIAYHHVSDTYLALFTHFIPCGVWEAVYIIEGLLKNASEVEPTTVHADTQGQSFPVFALAHLLRFDLIESQFRQDAHGRLRTRGHHLLLHTAQAPALGIVEERWERAGIPQNPAAGVSRRHRGLGR
ncbi:transposase [Streptomyces atratus]|uniref:transposase n=1 Tax=Streptomyces atratus TaxID=1893 RepID=UPI0021A57190|nr:transposase [Streptomyces atratus]MCT2543393.1 transposase [Streptomyces atratus]